MTDCFAIELSHPLYYYKAGEFAAKAGWKHKSMHHSDDFEIIIGLKGSFNIQISTVNEPTHVVLILPATCVVIPPNTTIEGVNESSDSIDFLWFHFIAEWHRSVIVPDLSVTIRPSVAESLLQVKRREFCREFNDLVILPERFHLEEFNNVLLSVRNLLSCANSYRYSQHENDLLTQVCLIELSNSYLAQTTNAISPDVKTGRIVEWLRAHMSTDMSVAAVAQHFEMNPDYLTRVFKQEQGVTVRQYLINLRMETAKVLLTRTQYPVSKVAHYAYFQDVRNFMKQFKHSIGMTPTSYRAAFTHTHMNNPYIDPSIPLPQEVARSIES
ncbi:AraC family transcriptional regulator [Bifidobacterium aquikefiri]|uniref:AraC family transcriptional regulator n=1 Tax=Bifidobacterium aquikefiri TaxID=1653207 RepID=UPI0023F4E8AE|nr:AraC family transcriptional regulator [Bifidobacterium aquikefiri]